MKLLYITSSAPWGLSEPFILQEMIELNNQGIDLLIIPRNPPKIIFCENENKLLKISIWLPLVNIQILFYFLKKLFSNTIYWKIMNDISNNSRNLIVLFKNLLIFPKASFLAEIIKNKNIKHIHAHWGSTTSTMAFIISQLTNIPWSFTLHRWDIKENNMLNIKTKSASFIRCISHHGKTELSQIVNNESEEKINVIHMGIKIPSKNIIFKTSNDLFTIIVPANLLEVKGHIYLIEALSILVSRGKSNIKCYFYGQGPLKDILEEHILKNNLKNMIEMSGNQISHETLINKYQNENIGAVILPSINTPDGQHEGIPVSLMEAMAYMIPVISTDTGGIPELIGDNCGIMVKEKDPESLANAIDKLMKYPTEHQILREKEREKVENDFNISLISNKLIELFDQNCLV